jgi:DHA1 family inner membrane transport protein
MDAGPGVVKSSTAPQKTGLPLVVYALALGTFLMLTTEFVVCRDLA